MFRLLDRIYRWAAVLAACAIGAICLLVTAQVALNAGTRAGLPLPPTIPSYADVSGYLLAAATFLALPWTLRSGGHVRVSLVTARLGRRAGLAVELGVIAAATAFCGYACVYAALLLGESWRFGDTSTGILAIPIWAVQVPMVAGLALLTLSLMQSGIETWIAGAPVLTDGEEA